jgi:valyl-tRNA synthetase
MTELPKTFDPVAIEAKWYAYWESTGAFRPARPDAETYTIVMPPPNVTGSLHIGHALDNTLQDILIRHARLQGKDALWVVGTDHAGIATQMVVERQMALHQDKRTNYSREDFVDKVWQWKAESGGTITRQLRRLGASCDWENERFTMDEGFSKAVIKVFVDLYNQGLLYRDKRLVNWDPHFKTAISDLEVETREVNGHMWHFKYPLAGGETYTYIERDADGNITLTEERDYIAIATTRPETMLGDGAVAVHPGDERYKPIVGKLCEIPVGPKEHRRLIPIITDEYPDPDFGSGAVKITGAHDQNDYGVAQRNGIPMYRLMDEVAAMRDDGPDYATAAARAKAIAAGKAFTSAEIDALNLVPDVYRGLDRYEARKRVVADIDADGLMIKVEDKVIQQPVGDRSGVVIEPMLTDQWYVDAVTLAKPAIEAVRSGAIKVVPQSWEKTYFNWMENIQPWCVSRQLWWGHRIPAWYDSDGNVYVAEDEATAQTLAGGRTIAQDEDVLDTWFSSALWPFGTLGWPGDVPSPSSGGEGGLLARHYPNDVLISGFDILFFWDARMIMQGLHFMKEVPWKTLYLHGLVRAADGSKMSKSKGNTVDPLGLIDQYGADALRFTLTAMESQGRDIKLDEKRVEGYRNFATKLWNAARFCQANGIGASTSVAAPKAELAVNRWIIGEVVETLGKLNQAIADLRFDAMADSIYHFAWGTFCDWYLELIKGQIDDETKAVGGWAFDQILAMLHPFMPFITEELWGSMGGRGGNLLIHAQWPAPEAGVDAEAKAEIEWVIDLITQIRSGRTELNIPPKEILPLSVRFLKMKLKMSDYYRCNSAAIERLARIKYLNNAVFPGDSKSDGTPVWREYAQEVGEEIKKGSMTILLPGFEAYAALEGVIDKDAERARITNAITAITKERDTLANRLNNPAFVEKAKPEAVEKARSDMAEKSAEAERLQAALARLG